MRGTSGGNSVRPSLGFLMLMASTCAKTRLHTTASSRLWRKQAYALFVAQFGYMPVDELRHVHITEFRDSQLDRGLHANSVRRHINMLNGHILETSFTVCTGHIKD